MAVEITQIDPTNFNSLSYESQETNLISSFGINTSLTTSSYIELHIYDLNSLLLTSDPNFTQYTVLNNGQSAGNGGTISQIEIDLEQTLLDEGFDTGEYITYFNFLNKKLGSNLQTLYITEINSDRTEIRLDSTSLTDLDIVEQTNNFIQERENSEYFLDFYINFGENELFIANNIALDNQDPTNPTVLIKLYEPLPETYDLNSQLWVVTSLEDPIAYNVSIEESPITIVDTLPLSGPNFNLDLKDQVNNSTLALSYDDLTSTSVSSSLTQIITILDEREIGVNIDFSNFSNFVHFSSAKSRLENFAYKVQLIEQYSSSLSAIDNITGATSSSIAVNENKIILQSKIDNIINNFDVYDYYLYYSEGPWAWPKTNSTPPYVLELSTSPAVLNWFGSTDEFNPYYGGVILSASLFDNNNKDNLKFSTPEYLRDDPNNAQYELFIDMVAQHFDNIWIYYKDTINKYNNDNRLDYGISKDLVADAIRDFGVKLYQNNFSNQDLYTAFLGLTPDGALFPFPEITGSLPTPTGFEYVDLLISASNDYIPLDDVNKSLYKRIYHNLPYLLKSKGTLPGLRALITSYGIPDTILRINEYGGKDKINSNDWDYWQDEFNYAFYTSGSNFITTPWKLNTSWNSPNNVPSTLNFRFKTNGLPTSSIAYSQSLWFNNLSSSITLTYTGSAYSSGSYGGSIIDPYYQYATLTFHPNASSSPNTSASVYLPFYDSGWWSVMVNRSGSNFTLCAGNKIYEGGDNGTLLGFYASSSIVGSITAWTGSASSSFARGPLTISTKTYTAFSGSLQEIRYYNTVLSESVFKDYIMNPYSIEGNTLNSGPNELAFRLPLGGELYTESISVHPKITGSWTPTSSFVGYSSASFNSTSTFLPNTEYFFYDQPIAGIKNAVSDKIRIENDSLPSGSVLSPLRALSQITAASASYTPSINLLEVALSPQDEINDDINSSLGFFNIGDYIGDPAFRSSQLQSYPNLDNLRNSYFEKYTKNYDLVDFVRLIKFFDNSLFKMIKDFIPARTSLASGIVIKQHLLERNRYPQPQVDPYSTIAYTTSGSTNNTPLTYQDISISGTLKPQWNDYNPGTVENFSGGTAGSFEIFNGINTSPYGIDGNGPDNIFGITQSWNETYNTPLGLVTILHDAQDEFYDGEFSGSVILVTSQSLNQPYPLENASFEYTPILYKNSLYGQSNNSTFTEGQFLNSLTTPNQGEILILASRYRLFPFPVTKGLAFVKINKIDANGIDNTITLGQLTNLLIQYTTSTTYENYEILNISEYPNYYLYEINKEDIPLEGLGIDNEIKNYYVSASITSPYLLSQSISPQTQPTTQVLTGWNSPLGNSIGYFNQTTGYYTLQNTPNIPIEISASITTSGSAGTFRLMLLRQGDYSSLATDGFGSGANVTTTLTASYYGLNGDQLYLRAYRGLLSSTPLTLKSSSLLITQSISPTASVQDSIIIEPYITQPNFYNSDQNPLLNNAVNDRLSSLYQDVDYSTDLLVPTNFVSLIDGNATKAAVQDSNYTTKRHILPRYDGSKSTSKKLNQWTRGDIGTYGKLPTVESLKSYVAYCDFIGGWPPERMNSSGAHIIYLIGENGNIITPNITENSLEINKGTFESGERIAISSKNISSGEQTQYRNIIRGGTRIEPILYTQSGSSPNAQWNTTMSFTDIIPSDTGAIGNYTALYSRTTNQILNYSSPIKVLFNNTIYGAALVSNSYVIPLNAVQDGVGLIIDANLNLRFINPAISGGPRSFIVTLFIYKNSTIIETVQYNPFNVYSNSQTSENFSITQFSLPAGTFNSGDTISIYVQIDNLEQYPGGIIVLPTNTTFKISQYPSYTLPITSSGANSIWGWPNKTLYPYVITSSTPSLVEIYNSNVKQIDITGSGFNPIALPWSIEYGDEFRFEGREDFVYQVGKIFGPADSGSNRITETGSIEVHFNANLPISASSSVFNLDHFLIRRYVDDPSLILFEGFKPTGAEGPFLIKPEFVSGKLNKDIDQFIVDLTQKGLL